MTRSPLRAFILLSLLLAPLSAGAADLAVHDPWIREAPPTASVNAAYMMLHNTGAEPVTLAAVRSPAFGHVEIHRTVMEDGMARMLRQDGLTVPAGGQVVLEPGGYHLMLFDAAAPPRAGDRLELILELDDGTEQTVTAPVRRGGGDGGHHHHQ